MTVAMTPYLRYGGVARDAMELYHSVFGGELSFMTFAEGAGETNPQVADQIMHSSLYVDRGLHLMASDTHPDMNVGPNGTIAISGSGEDGPSEIDTLKQWWSKLSKDSHIDIPLEQAPWGDYFGQLTDRYGVTWMFNIGADASQ